MKALHCLDCGDLVGAFNKPNSPRACICARHLIWTVGGKLNVACFDWKGTRDRAYLVRISNGLLQMKGESTLAAIQAVLRQPDLPQHFKDQRSLIVQTVIGPHPDSVWVDSLPAGFAWSDAPLKRRHLLGRLVSALWG